VAECQALLQRAKTAAIDARTLARLAATLQPAPWTPPPAIYTELQQRLTQRDALLNLRQQVRNQRHALGYLPVVVEAVRARMDDLIATFDAQIVAIEREIAQVLPQNAAWAASAALVVSIAGVGLLTAAWLLVATLNFTSCASPEAATAYAGLAPNPKESGTSVRGRERIGHGGNKRLRTALYLATLSAARYNPLIKAFYRPAPRGGEAEEGGALRGRPEISAPGVGGGPERARLRPSLSTATPASSVSGAWRRANSRRGWPISGRDLCPHARSWKLAAAAETGCKGQAPWSGCARQAASPARCDP